MLRREFLVSVLGVLGLSSFLGSHRSTYKHPVYGKYVGHRIKRNVERDKKGYFWFPLEVILTVEFEHFIVTYFNFNSSEDLARRVKKMDGARLFEQEGEDGILLFRDEVSCACELHGLPSSIPGKKAKFTLSAVTFR